MRPTRPRPGRPGRNAAIPTQLPSVVAGLAVRKANEYLHYLGGPTDTTKQRGDFDNYARGQDSQAGPPPFWACNGASSLGLEGVAEAEHVERLAKGFHPITGEPLVTGAGDGHVMGLDMTFSAPKNVSAIFAGADCATREAVAQSVRDAAKAALAYAESVTVTRHGHAGKIKRIAQSAIAACYSHFSSRAAGEPQLSPPILPYRLFARLVARFEGQRQVQLDL